MDTWNTFIESIKRTWEEIKSLFKRVFSAREEIEEEVTLRSTWSTKWDTRKNSQVTNRKPAFAIQKII